MSVRGRTCMLRPINDELVAHLNIVVGSDANREVLGIIAIEDLEAIIRCLGAGVSRCFALTVGRGTEALLSPFWSGSVMCTYPFFVVAVKNRE